MATYTTYKNLEKPLSTEKYNVGVANKNNDVIDSELHKLDLKNQSQDNLLATKNEVNEKIEIETTRATDAEMTLQSKILEEKQRAINEEIKIENDLSTEINRAISSEENISETISLNKPIWDDKYTRNEIDNKFSALETNIDWKEAVETFDDISSTYSDPEDGWTVNVNDTDITYRYNGTEWIPISANAIPKATDNIDGLLSKEDHAKYEDANNKKHVHTNKSILDGITAALITAWNAAKTHADSTHARVDATKVEKSENNGNIIVDDEEINVYTPDILNTIQSVEQNNDTGKLVDALVIKEVFQSVSEGKTAIASAITDKGIQTDATDTFQTMASNINNIQSSQINPTSLAIPLYFQLTNDGLGSSGMPCHTRLFIPSDAKKIAIKGNFSGRKLSGSGSVKSDFTLHFTNEDFMNKETINKLITCSTTGSITIKTITSSSSTQTTEQINVEYNISDYSDYGHFYYINILPPFLSSAQMHVMFLGTLCIYF